MAAARKTKRYPSGLGDEAWARTAPLLAKPAQRGRKPSVDLREVPNAIRCMTRTGLAHAAEGLPALADGVPVVPPLRAADAVSHSP